MIVSSDDASTFERGCTADLAVGRSGKRLMILIVVSHTIQVSSEMWARGRPGASSRPNRAASADCVNDLSSAAPSARALKHA